MSRLEVPQEFGFVLMVAVCVAVQCMLTAFRISFIRRKLFTKDFFAKNFPEIKEPPRGAYPDMGCGRYANKLPMEDWITFNNYQRSHYHYIENITLVLIALLVAGLSYPKLATIMGIVYIVGRELFGIGYRMNNAKIRSLGGISSEIVQIVFFIIAIMSGWNLGGGYNAFVKMLTS